MNENDIGEGFWVFVSHSTKDFEKVRLVRNALEDSGFRPILFYLKCMEDEDEINELLKREIDARRRFILCDSPNAQVSKFVQSEVEYIQSKKRMYEVIDLSSMDLGSENIKDSVLKMIKPFRKRTNVFLSTSLGNSHFANYYVKKYLTNCGFNSFDLSFITQNDWLRYGQEYMFKFIDEQIEATLNNGYFLYFYDSSNYSNSSEEFQAAYKIAPNMILFIITNYGDKAPEYIQHKNVIDVSSILSEEEKARAIVEALIAFDLKNQHAK